MRTVFRDDAEERLKAEFFGAQRGFFVEVGANDPQRGSQSFALEQAGWDGLLVEPQPELAAKLRRARTARVFAAACSSPKNAGKRLPLHLAGALSSLDNRLAVTGLLPQGTVEVAVRTLDEILTEAAVPAPIDFLSIDIEGHEVEALAGFDFARWRPRLILIEDHVTSLAIHRALVRAGYRLIRRTGLNGWYVPAATAPGIGFFGWWSLARKYYLGLPVRMLREKKRRLRDRLRSGRANACATIVGMTMF
jgi:FkbM family methyltransferase